MAKIIQFPGASEEDGANNQDGFPDDFAVDAANENTHPHLSLEDVRILGPMGRNGPEYEALVALYGASPEAAASSFEIDARMTSDTIHTVPVLGRLSQLLALVQDVGTVKMTQAGFLPVGFVSRLAEQAYKRLPQHPRQGGAREQDIPQLCIERRLATRAGLLALDGGHLKLTARGGQLLHDMNTPSHDATVEELRRTALNSMFAVLLTAHLKGATALDECLPRHPNELIPKARILLLFALAGQQGKLIYQEDLVDLLARLLPGEFRESIKQSSDEPLEMLEWDISQRFFNTFAVPFGFCTEEQQTTDGSSPGDLVAAVVTTDEQPHLKRSHGPWRVTSLYSQVFRFHREPPQESFLNDRQAALLLTDLAAGSTHEFYAQRYCMQAIERDPACAEAYVLLASIQRANPEQALKVLAAGIATGETQKPALRAGVSVWQDHGYRDVLRLRFARAELLVSMKRLTEAIAAYREILRIDPADNIGVRYKLVPLLVVDNQVLEAAHLVEAFSSGADEAESAYVCWNRTLIAYARGGAKEAGPLLETALAANEFVAEELLYTEPFPDTIPDSYYIGSPEEAMVYAEESQAAWRKVKGVRAWLRRKIEG